VGRSAKSKARKPAALPIDPDARISILEAFQRLRRHCGGVRTLAREQLDAALRLGGDVPGGVRLWAGDTIVDPNWYAQHLQVAAKISDGQWSVEFEQGGARLVDPRSCLWSVSAADIDALIKLEQESKGQGLPAHAKRGPKPHDWELFKAKFYLLLYDDDVPAHGDINIQRYADRLMTWGRNNFGEETTPEQASMRAKVAEWKPLWQRLRDANK
jgi:hypothetical protein